MYRSPFWFLLNLSALIAVPTWAQNTPLSTNYIDESTVIWRSATLRVHNLKCTELSAQDLTVKYRGKILENKQFTLERRLLPTVHALLLDVSDTMVEIGHFEKARQAFIDYVQKIPDGDQALILTIDESLIQAQSLTGDKAKLVNALQNIRPGYETTLYDSMYHVLQELGWMPGRKVLVVVSDGQDIISLHQPTEEKELLAFQRSVCTTPDLTLLLVQTANKDLEKSGLMNLQIHFRQPTQLLFKTLRECTQSPSIPDVRGLSFWETKDLLSTYLAQVQNEYRLGWMENDPKATEVEKITVSMKRNECSDFSVLQQTSNAKTALPGAASVPGEGEMRMLPPRAWEKRFLEVAKEWPWEGFVYPECWNPAGSAVVKQTDFASQGERVRSADRTSRYRYRFAINNTPTLSDFQFVLHSDNLGMHGCLLDVRNDRGLAVQYNATESPSFWDVQSRKEPVLIARPFVIRLEGKEPEQLPATPQQALREWLQEEASRLKSEELSTVSPPFFYEQPRLLQGQTFLDQRVVLAQGLFHQPSHAYQTWVKKILAQEFAPTTELIAKSLAEIFRQSSSPQIQELANQPEKLREFARDSVEGKSLQGRIDHPSLPDIQRLLGAWLGDISAADLFLALEKELIANRLSQSRDAGISDQWFEQKWLVIAWQQLSRYFALPRSTRVLAFMLPVYDRQRQAIGYWRVVLPRPSWICEREPRCKLKNESPGHSQSNSREKMKDLPYDHLPPIPLALTLVDMMNFANDKGPWPKGVLRNKQPLLPQLVQQGLSLESVHYQPLREANGANPNNTAMPFAYVRVELHFAGQNGDGRNLTVEGDFLLQAQEYVLQRAEAKASPEGDPLLKDAVKLIHFPVDGSLPDRVGG